LIFSDDVVEVGPDLMTGHPGTFAGGDMVPSERIVTVAIGHRKKAARSIDAFLREILVQSAMPGGAEHDRPVVPPVVHRQHGRAEPALVSDPADPARGNQPQALGLVKLLDHAVSHGSAP
jgi:hypothetical protein